MLRLVVVVYLQVSFFEARCAEAASNSPKQNPTAVVVNFIEAIPKFGVIPEQVSDARWVARADATRALVDGSKEIKAALTELSEDHVEQVETKH